jgi:hypothetical protein
VDDEDSVERATAEARARAASNLGGVGAAYVGPPAPDRNSPGWRGMVAVSDGESVSETLFVAREVPRYAVDHAALAATVERIVADRGGLGALHELSEGNMGIVLNTHAHEDELRKIFRPS